MLDAIGRSKADFYGSCASKTQADVSALNLPTVCFAARCPNRGECYKNGDATVMILGDVCTRGCSFCAVDRTRKPLYPQPDESARMAELAKKLNTKYLVLTMPTRDDLLDGGAQHIKEVINEVRAKVKGCLVEALISDLNGSFSALETVLGALPAVLAHNVETVPSLYKAVRAGSDYKRSLSLLENSKKINAKIPTKTSIMLGMGETEKALRQTFRDLRAVGCDLLTLGQYLAPSKEHYPVKEYPQQAYYDELAQYAKDIGFKGVLAAPLTRSSYKAGELYLQYTK